MKAIEICGPGGPDVLRLIETARPEPGPGEVQIAVAAAGVNRPDVLQRKGLYPPPAGASPLPGLEVAGVVIATGAGVDAFRAGDEVCALVAGGGYAEVCVAPALQCLPKPESLSFEEAACLPEALFTVWTNLFDRAGFRAGEVVLVHGAASGIGATAIPLVKAFGGVAIGTARGAQKAAACEALGADLIVDSSAGGFVEPVMAFTDGKGVDIVLDIAGGDYLGQNVAVAAPGARLVSVAFLRGARAEIDLNQVMQKRLTITGSTLRSRSPEEKGAIRDSLLQQAWPCIASGKFRPIVFKTFPLSAAAQAHELMESNRHVGKLVLTLA